MRGAPRPGGDRDRKPAGFAKPWQDKGDRPAFDRERSNDRPRTSFQDRGERGRQDRPYPDRGAPKGPRKPRP